MKDSFEAFYEANYPGSLRFALKLTRNVDDAADLAQEAFLRAMQAFENRDESRSGESWMMQIIYNLFVDHCRRRKMRPVTISTSELLLANPAFEVPAGGPSPEEVLIANTLSEPISQAMGKLSAGDRALIFFALTGASLKAMAEALGCTVSKAKSRLHRAFVALKHELLAIDTRYASLCNSGALQRNLIEIL